MDEAHQLPDIASQYSASRSPAVSFRIGEGYHHRLSHRTQRYPAVAEVRGSPGAKRAGFPSAAPGRLGYRGNLRESARRQQIQRALLLLDDALELVVTTWQKLSLGRSALLDAAFERATLDPWTVENGPERD
ncbi:hypothetical protein ACNKHS_08380 [Shigella flexneri]